MEIILLENIINLGNIGDKVKVKDGYGRNFLLKKSNLGSLSNSEQRWRIKFEQRWRTNYGHMLN